MTQTKTFCFNETETSKCLMQHTLAEALGPVYMNAFSSKTISVSMKKQRLHCIYTLFSYRFYIVRFGNRFSKVTVFSRFRVDAK